MIKIKRYIINEFITFNVRNKSSLALATECLLKPSKETDNQALSKLDVVPVVSYSNADKDKSRAYEDNKKKCGIYR